MKFPEVKDKKEAIRTPATCRAINSLLLQWFVDGAAAGHLFQRNKSERDSEL